MRILSDFDGLVINCEKNVILSCDETFSPMSCIQAYILILIWNIIKLLFGKQYLYFFNEKKNENMICHSATRYCSGVFQLVEPVEEQTENIK